MTLGEKLDKAYRNIQSLQIQPSRSNVMLLAEILLLLEDVAKALEPTEETEEAEE